MLEKRLSSPEYTSVSFDPVILFENKDSQGSPNFYLFARGSFGIKLSPCENFDTLVVNFET